MRARLILIVILLLFTASKIFAQENGYTEWMNSAVLTTKLYEMDQNRLFPYTVEGRLNGTAIQYRAQFIPYLPNMEYFQSRWGMTENWYKAYSVQLIKAGFKEVSHTSFIDLSGTTLHQVTWVLIPDQQKPTGVKYLFSLLIIGNTIATDMFGFGLLEVFAVLILLAIIYGLFITIDAIKRPAAQYSTGNKSVWILFLLLSNPLLSRFYPVLIYLLSILCFVGASIAYHIVIRDRATPTETNDDSREERIRRRFEDRER